MFLHLTSTLLVYISFSLCWTKVRCGTEDYSRAVSTGSDVELICSLPNRAHTFRWNFLPTSQTDPVPLEISSRIKIRSTAESSTLGIEHVSIEDSGSYICEVTITSTGEITANNVTLTVSDELIETTTWPLNTSPYMTTDMPLISSDAPFVSLPFTDTSPLMSTQTPPFPATASTDLFFSNIIELHTTTLSEDESDITLYNPPQNLEVIALSDVSGDGSVEILVRWDSPSSSATVDLYTIYHSSDKSASLRRWSSADVMETSLHSRVKTKSPTYFRVRAVNSVSRSPLSSTVMFYFQQGTLSASGMVTSPYNQVHKVSTPPLTSFAAGSTTTMLTTTAKGREDSTERKVAADEGTAYSSTAFYSKIVASTVALSDGSSSSVVGDYPKVSAASTESTTTFRNFASPERRATMTSISSITKKANSKGTPESTGNSQDMTMQFTDTTRQPTDTTLRPADRTIKATDVTRQTGHLSVTTGRATAQPTLGQTTAETVVSEQSTTLTARPDVQHNEYSKSPSSSSVDLIPNNQAVIKQKLNSIALKINPIESSTTPHRTSPSITERRWPPAPQNFMISRGIVASDRVIVNLNWEISPATSISTFGPVTSFTIRFTDNIDLDVAMWRSFTVADSEYSLALRLAVTYYFAISATTASGIETELSPLYKYSSSSLKSVECLDEDCVLKIACQRSIYGCCSDGKTIASGPDKLECLTSKKEAECRSTQWGCCSNGESAAAGPDFLGCAGDPQPCDISPYQCCPDGVNPASGTNFTGCESQLETPPESEILDKHGRQNCSASTLNLLDNDGDCGKLFSSLADTCKLARDPGTCTNYVINWYYDVTSGSCRRFYYGGCAGNANRYNSKEHCQSICAEPPGIASCLLPAISGRCRNFTTRWNYDRETKQCQQFQYGGCVGNSNNFKTKHDCQNFCQPHRSHGMDVCNHPQKVGMCKGSFTRWWYNRRSGRCEQFLYSGCGGNDNRFPTPQDCERLCGSKERRRQGQCTAKKDVGPCLALIPSWHFDSVSGVCSPFYYGGCGGNTNRYSSEKECYQRCGRYSEKEHLSTGKPDQLSVCQLPLASGSCSMQVLSYYYDKTTGVCREFIFSGCEGNANRFTTLSSCRTQCMKSMIEENTRDQGEGCQLTDDCPTRCPYGYLSDSQGCPSCKCRDPCQSLHCDARSSCVIQTTNCIGTDCAEMWRPICQPTSSNSTSQDKNVAAYIRRAEGIGSQFVGNVGANIQLPCDARGNPQPTVVWYKDRKPLQVNNEISKYSVSSANNSLTIENLQQSDGGEFICRAFNGIGDAAYEYITVTVHAGVTIVDGPSEFTSSRSSTVVIRCDVEGSPPPQVIWVFLGELLTPGGGKYSVADGGQSLSVHNLTSADEGDYVCIARNILNSASKTFTLTLRGASNPTNSVIHLTQPLRANLRNHSLVYDKGDTLSLSCDTTGFPQAKVEWLRNDETLPYESRISIYSNSVRITDLVEKDAGYYTCLATNQYEALSVTTTIQVNSKPVKPQISPSCQDQPELADCDLIVRFKYCSHAVYRVFCCRSCALAMV